MAKVASTDSFADDGQRFVDRRGYPCLARAWPVRGPRVTKGCWAQFSDPFRAEKRSHLAQESVHAKVAAIPALSTVSRLRGQIWPQLEHVPVVSRIVIGRCTHPTWRKLP